jgi:hypothetical protein
VHRLLVQTSLFRTNPIALGSSAEEESDRLASALDLKRIDVTAYYTRRIRQALSGLFERMSAHVLNKEIGP